MREYNRAVSDCRYYLDFVAVNQRLTNGEKFGKYNYVDLEDLAEEMQDELTQKTPFPKGWFSRYMKVWCFEGKYGTKEFNIRKPTVLKLVKGELEVAKIRTLLFRIKERIIKK